MLLHQPVIYVKCVLQLFSDDLNGPPGSSCREVQPVRSFPVYCKSDSQSWYVRQTPTPVIGYGPSRISKDVPQFQSFPDAAPCSERDQGR
jgi:hypothetical protein